jgi:hypothetical protein
MGSRGTAWLAYELFFSKGEVAATKATKVGWESLKPPDSIRVICYPPQRNSAMEFDRRTAAPTSLDGLPGP